MAKLYFNTPLGTGLGALGSLGGGLAEGLYMGQDLSMRRKAMEQDEKRQQLQAAMQLLGLGAKAEDPAMVQAINTYLGRIDPNAPQIPAYDPSRAAQREMSKITAQADAMAQQMGIPKGTPQYARLLESMAGLKPEQEYTMMQGPDGQMYPVKKGSELATIAKLMTTEAYLKKVAQGGGRGGGGGGAGKISNWVNWRDAKGNVVGQGPFNGPRPPGAVYFTKISTTDPTQPSEAPTPMGPADPVKVAELTKIATGKDPLNKTPQAMRDAAMTLKGHFGVPVQATEEGGFKIGQTPLYKKPKPPKKVRAFGGPEEPEEAPDTVQVYEVPPPPDEIGE